MRLGLQKLREALGRQRSGVGVSDAYGQQREARPRLRTERPRAVPDLAPARTTTSTRRPRRRTRWAPSTGPERDLVEFHVRFCQRCAATVERDLRTTGMLPFVVAPMAPPPDVKAALFARIGHAERALAAPVSAPSERPALRSMPTLPSSHPVAPLAAAGPVVAASASSGRSLGWIGSVLSVPLLVALVATGFWGRPVAGPARLSGVSDERSGSAGRQLRLEYVDPDGAGDGDSPGGRPIAAGGQRAGRYPRSRPQLQHRRRRLRLWGWDGNGNYGPIGDLDLEVGTDGTGKAEFHLDQPFSSYEAVQIVPEAVDGEPRQDDVVLQFGNAQLGSTGSGLAPTP
jgi:hypothetical protein